MKAQDIPSGLESPQLHKPSKSFPTYALLQKIWNKAKQLQQDTVWNKKIKRPLLGKKENTRGI